MLIHVGVGFQMPYNNSGFSWGFFYILNCIDRGPSVISPVLSNSLDKLSKRN